MARVVVLQVLHASVAARTSRALAAAPRVHVVGEETLLCGTQATPAARKHKEKFSQAPGMPMVQVLMQQSTQATPAARKHKDKFSQAPDMPMVQVLMQQTISDVIRSQSLAPKAAQAATLTASSAVSAALGVLCAQLGIPIIAPPDPAASKPKSQEHMRTNATDAVSATSMASSSHKTSVSGSASCI